ncbi:BTB domain-containing protein [Mycena chlorophos]|uniref:BTB domain-containing protein n=1 Tax=Mycena chlorophos TaxID=658473 RepID=A0A8H6VZZ8_MYCCL|nr:BTB domain-containing protein [Mycena chlorophos]
MSSASPTNHPPKLPISEPSQTIIRSPDFFFEDGSIILQVQSTQFRVAKSMLALHSTVLRDMFTLPLPANEPMVEGCPVVVLPGDTAEDWAHLLGVMYPKSFLRPKRPTFPSIAAVIRLGKKYDMARFRQEALAQLKSEFPSALEDLDELAAEGYWQYIHAGKSAKQTLASAIALAREVSLLSVLPVMFYHLKPSDDTKAMLSLADRVTQLEGHLALLRLQEETTMKWLRPADEADADDGWGIPSNQCRHPLVCEAALKQTAFTTLRSLKGKDYVLDEWSEEWEEGLCENCRETAKAIHEEGRKECWRQLPVVFGLADSWEELAKLDFE